MEKIRINKYISDAGFCSRREADRLITDERVTVNGVLATIGTKVSLDDKVRIDGEILRPMEILPEDKHSVRRADQKQKQSSLPFLKKEKETSKKNIHRGTRGGERKRVEKKVFSQSKSVNVSSNKSKKGGRSGNR